MKKREYPKTVFRKKITKAVFWTGFALVFFLSVIAIVRVGNATAGSSEPDQPQQDEASDVINLASGEGGQSFAQNFAAEYFSWGLSDEDKEKRMKLLSRYLATGLDEQAGLSFEGMEWGSSLKESQVWKVEETGDDSALVTLRVLHESKKTVPPDPEAVKKAKEDKKDPPKAKEEKDGPHEKYFVVPVKTDGQSFAVHEIPYLTAAPEKPDITAEPATSEDGKLNDSEIQQEIHSFLNTFFKVYTTGTAEELAYYTETDDIQSMNGVLLFKEVKNFIVREGERTGEYQIDANVLFEDELSKAKMAYPYQLTVTQVNDRWFVQRIEHR